jgi:RNA recognition motif-containing protein
MPALLVVDRLPRHFLEQELADLVCPFGTVLSAVVVCSAGQSLSFGFVEFTDAKDAGRAMAALNGQEISGHRITVALVQDPSSTPA